MCYKIILNLDLFGIPFRFRKKEIILTAVLSPEKPIFGQFLFSGSARKSV